MELQARDDFIAIAAHELRNPMTPIAGEVELLLMAARRDKAPPTVVTRLERLDSAVRHYIRRATTLLNTSRASTGRICLEPAIINLSEVVEETVSSYRLTAARAGCALTLHAEQDVVGTWDPLAVEEILDNLLSNAVKFGAGKPIDVWLGADDEEARLVVRDRGIGISAEDRARIFGRFEQAVGQRRHGGFGIGLWLVARLVEAMGGCIAIDSRPGEGAAFTVCLPRRGRHDAAGATPPP